MLGRISPSFNLLEELCLAQAVARAGGFEEDLLGRARASAAKALGVAEGDGLDLFDLRLWADAVELSDGLGIDDARKVLERLAETGDPLGLLRDLAGGRAYSPPLRFPLSLVCPEAQGPIHPWREVVEAICKGLSLLEEELPGHPFWVRLARDVLGAISRATSPLEGRTAELVQEALGLKGKRVFCAGCSPVAGGTFVSFEFLRSASGRGPVALVRRTDSAFLLPLDLLEMAAWERGHRIRLSREELCPSAELNFRRALRRAKAEVLSEISKRIGPRYASLAACLEGEALDQQIQGTEAEAGEDLRAALEMIGEGIPPVQLQLFDGEDVSLRPIDPLSVYEAFARSMGRSERGFCDLVRAFDVCAETLDLLSFGG